MTTLTAQQIACVYAWLAQLFSRELDDEQLTQIASAQMAEWFSLLKSEPPLTATVNGLENSIATLTVRDDARLELAADFCGLFLMTDNQAALPYASAYKQDEQEIKRLLVEAGMETSGNFNEPADHLAIYLELLSHLHFSLGRMRRERLIRPTGTVLFVGLIRCVKRRIRHYGAVAGCGMNALSGLREQCSL